MDEGEDEAKAKVRMNMSSCWESSQDMGRGSKTVPGKPQSSETKPQQPGPAEGKTPKFSPTWK